MHQIGALQGHTKQSFKVSDQQFPSHLSSVPEQVESIGAQSPSD